MNKVLVGNKADMDESKRVCNPFLLVLLFDLLNFMFLNNSWIYFFQAVPTSKGQALADEYGIKFFETVSGTQSFCYDIPLL